MNIQSLLAGRVQGMKPSPIRKLVPIMRMPGMISLGGGYPNAQTFAFTSVDVVFKSGREFKIRDKAVDLACQYGPTDASADLKPHILRWHEAKDGVALKGDQVQVLNGAQEGLHTMAYLFLEREDSVIMSEPAYPGALGAFRAFTERFIAVPLDEQGMITTELERILAMKKSAGERLPKFIYDVPNGNNPAGVSLSLERRRHLLQIAARHDLLILEDDPYQMVQLEDSDPLPTLQSMDRDGRVVRLDSFSKIFAPGLRLGYASGPAEIVGYFQLYKQGLNLHTSAMDQALLTGFFASHTYEEFRALIRENCGIYRRNRDAVLAAARKHLPVDIRYNVPLAGMFIWFEMPAGFDAERMVETDGVELKILLVPGCGFSTTGGLKNYMRASFSMIALDQVEEGMIRFAKMIERERKRIGA
ncbi:MAG: PLP-dependent aminotransferase family protein [Deltaproteobacteria bacterium]|nr:PLP-dependent aminotransferase family protein [Deltaproteobacteria bacterium]